MRGIQGIQGMGMVAVVSAAALLRVGVAEGQERVDLPGERVAIYNLAGEVEVVPGSGADVVVHLSRGGEDGGRLEVRSGDLGGRSTLRIIYPGDRIVYGSGAWRGRISTRVAADGTFGSGGDRVQVASSGDGLRAHADLRIEVPPGRDVQVHLGVGRMRATRIVADLLLDNGSGSITVEDVQGRLDVDTGSGSVEVRTVRGPVRIDTGSGGVRLQDVQGDRVEVDTGSGSVRGASIQAGLLEVDTGSGTVALDDVSSPDIRVDTGSGSVELGLRADVERANVDTGSGSVTLRIPRSLGAEIDAETGSGGITIDVPGFESSTRRRNYIHGRIGDGRGRIRVETGSGGVSISTTGG